MTLIFLLSSGVAMASGGALDAKSEALAEQVAHDLQPFVSTLNKDALFFNYTTRSGKLAEISAPFDPAVRDHVKKTISSFGDLDPAAAGSAYGHGFYLAVDPLMGRSYGGDDFALFILKIPAGTRFLKLFDEPKLSGTVKANLEARCRIKDKLNKYETLGLMFRSASAGRGCLEIGKRVLEKLQVDGISYPFGNEGFTACADIHPGALLLTNAALIDQLSEEDVEMLTAEIPGNDSARPLRKILQTLPHMLDLHRTFHGSQVQNYFIWPSESVGKASPKEVLQWMRTNLLTCQSRN